MSICNLNKMIDRIEAIRELSWDIKYSSIDLGCEIEDALDKLEETFRTEMEIKERSLLTTLKP